MWISSTFAVTALVAGSLSVGPAAAAEGALTLCFSKSPTGPGSWAGQYAVAEPGKVCDPTGGAPLTSMLTASLRCFRSISVMDRRQKCSAIPNPL